MSFEEWASHEVEALGLGLKLRRPSPRESIFKYVSLHSKTSWDRLATTLNECHLTGSTQTALNDPFEMSPYVFDDLRPATISKAVGNNQSLADRLAGKEWNPQTAFADVDRFRSEAKSAFSKFQSNARVIAFCERSDSPLLWSHYANSYRGACLHFVGGAFDRFGLNFGAVTYSSHRPTYPLSLALRLAAKSNQGSFPSDVMARTESNKIVYFTKAADWSYEKEVRIVYDNSRMSSVKFQEDGLLSIILGPRVSNEDEVRIRDIIRVSKMPHLPVRKAELSNNSFSVEIA